MIIIFVFLFLCNAASLNSAMHPHIGYQKNKDGFDLFFRDQKFATLPLDISGISATPINPPVTEEFAGSYYSLIKYTQPDKSNIFGLYNISLCTDKPIYFSDFEKDPNNVLVDCKFKRDEEKLFLTACFKDSLSTNVYTISKTKQGFDCNTKGFKQTIKSILEEIGSNITNSNYSIENMYILPDFLHLLVIIKQENNYISAIVDPENKKVKWHWGASTNECSVMQYNDNQHLLYYKHCNNPKPQQVNINALLNSFKNPNQSGIFITSVQYIPPVQKQELLSLIGQHITSKTEAHERVEEPLSTSKPTIVKNTYTPTTPTAGFFYKKALYFSIPSLFILLFLGYMYKSYYCAHH